MIALALASCVAITRAEEPPLPDYSQPAQGQPTAPAAKDGFTVIFDGETLAGWSAADMSFWSVEDGAITGRITDEHPTDRNHYLVWQGGELADFELVLNHRIMSEHTVNGGFQFRSEIFDSGIPDDCRGYQVDNNTQTNWGVRLYDEFGRHTLAWRGQHTTFGTDGARTTTPLEGGDAPQPSWFDLAQWHEYHLVCRGREIRLFVDGRLAAAVTDLDPSAYDLSGLLALQLHSGPPMTVQFKNIRLKKL
jgi:hypothetical protein